MRRVLAISLAIQGVLLLLLIFCDPLRKSRLAAGEADVKALDQEADIRRREREKQHQLNAAEKPLPAERAGQMLKEKENRERPEMQSHIEEMERIRDEVARIADRKLDELNARKLEDVSAGLYDLLHPLATQLVANAKTQADEMPVHKTPEVEAIAEKIEDFIESRKVRLMETNTFAKLAALHQKLQASQHEVIMALDQVQQQYLQNEDRIRRENHVEYLVNLMRDQMAGVLRETNPVDPATMNTLPAGTEMPVVDSIQSPAADTTTAVPEMVTQARQLYEQTARNFALARAAELALQRGTSMQQAWSGLTMPPPPDGSGSSNQPGGTPGTLGSLQARLADIDAARRAVQQMWESTCNLNIAASAMNAGSPSPAAGNGKGSTHQHTAGGGTGARSEIAGLAAGRNGRFSDMTVFQYGGGGGGEKGFSGGSAGGLDLTDRGIRSGYRETGPGTPGAKEALLSESRVIAQALPGRMFSRSSPRTGWLYLDTWYVIGPWENHGRTTFEVLHPPETLIDLDGEYTGKDAGRIRWQFHQSDNIRITPPVEMESSTYYAYTEVFFEDETEMLVAVASDDAARVWINDLLIWEDHGNSPWRLDEGFRKVRFRKGFNNVLVRIENGPILCTFSILLCPPGVIAGS